MACLNLRGSNIGKTIADPESLTGKELLNTSLSSLSKNLPQTTSSRATISLYLRWLETQRVSETSLTLHWSNTVLHWCQALQLRGFRESEIVSEVRNWKRANPERKKIWGRESPSSSDIEKAFADESSLPIRSRDREKENREERKRKSDRMDGDSYRPPEWTRPEKRDEFDNESEPRYHKPKSNMKSYDQSPPSNYICNRCGKKGHHLQVCPTNMDPNYDLPPDDDYVCMICDARGTHFKSLCPGNKDPNSIIQRRKKRGIVTTPTKKAVDLIVDWERDVEKQSSANRIGSRDRERGRLSRASDSGSGSSSNSLTPSRASKMEKLQDIEAKKRKIFGDGSMELTGVLTMKSTHESAEKDLKGIREQERYSDTGRLSETSSPRSETFGERKRARTSGQKPTNNPKTSSSTIVPTKRIEKLFSNPACNDEEDREEDNYEKKQMLRDANSGYLNNREMGQYSRPLRFEPHPPDSRIKYAGRSTSSTSHAIQAGPYYEVDTETTDYTNTDDDQTGGDFEANVTPAGQNFALRPIGKPPGLMSIDETDSTSAEEMHIDEPILHPPVKTYHPEILNLIQTRGEMSKIVHPIHMRHTALDMWNQDDQKRRERRRARRSEQNQESASHESTPREGCSTKNISRDPTQSGHNDRSPSQESVYYGAMGFSQFDGASDEREPKASPSRKISAMGKEGVEKMREITANVTRSFPSLKLKVRSPYYGSGKSGDADEMEIDSNQSKASVSSMRVNAASSALKLTEANMESVVSDPGMKHRQSKDSFDSLAVNLPGNRVVVSKKQPDSPITRERSNLGPGHLVGYGQTLSSRDFRQDAKINVEGIAYETTEEDLIDFFEGYAVEHIHIRWIEKQNRQTGWATVWLSTLAEAERAVAELSGKEVRGRNVDLEMAELLWHLREKSEATLDDLKQYAGTLKVPTTAPEDVLSLMSNDPAKPREIGNKSLADALETSTLDEIRNRTKSVAPLGHKATVTNKQTDNQDFIEKNKGFQQAKIRATKDETKKFSENFKLKTQVPEDIGELFKQGEKR